MTTNLNGIYVIKHKQTDTVVAYFFSYLLEGYKVADLFCTWRELENHSWIFLEKLRRKKGVPNVSAMLRIELLKAGANSFWCMKEDFIFFQQFKKEEKFWRLPHDL